MMGAMAVSPLLASAVIVAFPLLTACTLPLESTVATELSLERHVYVGVAGKPAGVGETVVSASSTIIISSSEGIVKPSTRMVLVVVTSLPPTRVIVAFNVTTPGVFAVNCALFPSIAVSCPSAVVDDVSMLHSQLSIVPMSTLGVSVVCLLPSSHVSTSFSAVMVGITWVTMESAFTVFDLKPSSSSK